MLLEELAHASTILRQGMGKDSHACMFVQLALFVFDTVVFIISLATEPVSCSLLAASTHGIIACQGMLLAEA